MNVTMTDPVAVAFQSSVILKAAGLRLSHPIGGPQTMTATPSETSVLFADLNTSLPLRIITQQIERLAISADVKAILLDLAKITVNIGGTIVKIGAKILTVVFDIISQFPNTTFGVVISVCLGLLIGSIPLIGTLLAPFLMPLLVAFGLVKGAIADLANAGWAARIRDLEVKLSKVSV
jgi:hypothetical protein